MSASAGNSDGRPAPEEHRRRRCPVPHPRGGGRRPCRRPRSAATVRGGRTRWRRRSSRSGAGRRECGRTTRRPHARELAYVTRAGTDLPRPGLAASRHGGTLAGAPVLGRRGPPQRSHWPRHLLPPGRGGRRGVAGHPQCSTGDLCPQPGGPGRRRRRERPTAFGPANLAATAGHSLGEYSALVAAGVLEANDGARLVQARGEAMQAAADANPGTMAAVLGLSVPEVAEACGTTDGAWVANDNTPGQVVVAGTRARRGPGRPGRARPGSQARDRPPGRWCLPLAAHAPGPGAARPSREGDGAFRRPAARWWPTSTPGPTPTGSPPCCPPSFVRRCAGASRSPPWPPWAPPCSWNWAGDRAVGHGAPHPARSRPGQRGRAGRPRRLGCGYPGRRRSVTTGPGAPSSRRQLLARPGPRPAPC